MTLEKNDPELLSELNRDEGFVPHAYQDHLGFWTIGVGRLIDKRKGGRITVEESNFLLGNDIETAMSLLDKNLPWWRHLTERRQRVLTNMAFNLGIGSSRTGTGLLGFKNTLAMIQVGNYDGAARGMLNSKWASQVGDRAVRLANMMREG